MFFPSHSVNLIKELKSNKVFNWMGTLEKVQRSIRGQINHRKFL